MLLTFQDKFKQSCMSTSGSDSGDELNECEDKLDEDDSGTQCHNDLLSFHSFIVNHRSLKTSLTTSPR